MPYSFLIMGPELEAQIRRVREHAEKLEHIYRGHGPIPGDDPAFVLTNGMFKVVYSLTQGEGPIVRHISASTSNEGMFPNQITVYTLCHLFGFTGAQGATEGGTATGPGEDWAIFYDGPAIAVQQVFTWPTTPARA